MLQSQKVSHPAYPGLHSHVVWSNYLFEARSGLSISLNHCGTLGGKSDTWISFHNLPQIYTMSRMLKMVQWMRYLMYRCRYVHVLHVDWNIIINCKYLTATEENNQELASLKSSPSFFISYSETCHYRCRIRQLPAMSQQMSQWIPYPALLCSVLLC